MSGGQSTAPVLRRRIRADGPWAALLIFILATYVIVATGGSFTFREGHNLYGMFGDALLAGRLHFLVEPPPELLALPNPLAWEGRAELLRAQVFNPSNYVHDAILYQGKYYLISGPAPALLHMLSRLALGDHLSDSAGTVIFGFLSCVGFTLLVRQVQQREFPDTPEWLGALVVLTYALGGVSLYVQGLAQVYGESVAATACFVTWGLLFWWRGAHGGLRAELQLALAGLMLGCAVGTRISALGFLIASAIAGTLVCLQWKSRSRVPGAIAVIWIATVLPMGLLLSYNAARFGSPFDFGERFVLISGDASTRSSVPFSYAILALNVGAYFSPPAATVGLSPFILFRGGTTLPVDGLAFVMEGPLAPIYLLCPIVLLSPVFGMMALRRARWPWSPLTLLLGLSSAGILFCLGIFAIIPVAAARYLQDFLPAAVLVSGVGFFSWYQRWSRQTLARRLVVGSLALLTATAIVGGVTLLLNDWGARAINAPTTWQFESFEHLAYRADCATEAVASALSPGLWADEYLAKGTRRWNLAFVPSGAEIPMRGPPGAPLWGIEVDSRLSGDRMVTVESSGRNIGVVQLRPGAQTLRFQEEARFDDYGVTRIRLVSDEPMGTCGTVLWDASLGVPRIGTVADGVSAARLHADVEDPSTQLPADDLTQRQQFARMRSAYSAILGRLASDAQIARRAAALDREQAERLAGRLEALRRADDTGQRPEIDLATEIARLQAAVSALHTTRDRVRAEPDAALRSASSSAAEPHFRDVPPAFVLARTLYQWQARIGLVRRFYSLRLDEAVSDVAAARSEAQWLRKGPIETYTRTIREMEALETPDRRTATALVLEEFDLHEARNALELEIERELASLREAQRQSRP